MPRRRDFLASRLATAMLPRVAWADAGDPAYPALDPDGSFALYGFTAGGSDVFRIPLPGRGQAAAAHPTENAGEKVGHGSGGMSPRRAA